MSTAIQTPLIQPHTSAENHDWLMYSIASFIFGALGQFSMGFLSESMSSRYIISLGDVIFVIFFGLFKYVDFYFKNHRWANIRDCGWIDPDTGHFKEGSLPYLWLCIISRFIYGFVIVLAFSEANANDMNLGIILSIRSSEALFVSLMTYIYLKEKLSFSKILGLFILTFGVVGVCVPNDSNKFSGFSIAAVLWAILSALVSSLRNFAVKRLAKLKIDGDTITMHAVFWADLSTVLVGLFMCIWNDGFNHVFYDKWIDQQSIELTWRRLWFSIGVGFLIYFSLSSTANANQLGFAG